MLDVEQNCQWNFAIFGEGWDPSRPLIRNLWILQWNFIDILSVSCDWCCAGGAPGPAAPGRAGHVPDVDQDARREAGARTLVMLPDTATIWLLRNTLRSNILHLVPCACLPQLLSWLSSQVNHQPKDNRNNLAQISKNFLSEINPKAVRSEPKQPPLRNEPVKPTTETLPCNELQGFQFSQFSCQIVIQLFSFYLQPFLFIEYLVAEIVNVSYSWDQYYSLVVELLPPF